MKTRGLSGALVLLTLSACGGRQTSSTTPAVAANGQTVTTAAGTAVNETANTRFNSAAALMRQHDEANGNRGDWTPETCNEVAGLFETAANAQANGAFPEAWFNRGLAYDRCGMNDQATTALNRAIQVSPANNNCRAKVQLGVMAYRRHDVPAARQAFEQAIQQDQTHCVEGYTNLAMVLREANPTTPAEWAPVVRNIRSALALDDRYLPARTQLALSYLQQAGDDPNSRMIFLAGLVCAQAAQVSQAQNAEINPDVRSFTADLYNTWGIIDIRRNEIIKALEHFRRAYTLNPNMFEAWVNYGTINLSFRGYQDAKEAFEHAIALRDDSYDAHVGLGVALRGLALTQPDAERATTLASAQREYERARTLDANRPDAYYNLGVLNMNYLGGTIPVLRTAQEFLQQFVQRAGSNARFVTSVGNANRHIRNIGSTITALEAVGGGSTPAPATPAAPAAAAPAPAAGQAAPPAASP
ncbi:MAG: Domain containing protein [Myxococcaceae bacterium]|nr:Domain containing protein [Myxococcaceae bacterium]